MTTQTAQAETGMDMRDLLADEEFLRRRRDGRAPDRESVALRALAQVFAERPHQVLQKLVDVAVEFCQADSSGISLEETTETGEERFRWIVVSGSFERYLNGTTPRGYSPCGTCLDSGRPQLYRLTQPYYDFLGVEARPIVDGVLIPWISGDVRGTLWAVSHSSTEAFDASDYTLLKSLADFAAIALRHDQQQTAIRRREQEAASAARAHQLAHEINNPLQRLTNTLYLAQQGGEDSAIFLQQAAREVAALSQLVSSLLAITYQADKD